MRDGTCVSLPPSAGRPDASVSGRLADSGFFSGVGLLGKGSGSQLVPGTGNCGQSGEINSASISRDSLSGNQDRFADFQGFGDSHEDRKVLLNSRRISVFKGAVWKSRRVLLGHLASLTHFVLNGQLRMRALQLALKRGWDFRDEEILVPWDQFLLETIFGGGALRVVSKRGFLWPCAL